MILGKLVEGGGLQLTVPHEVLRKVVVPDPLESDLLELIREGCVRVHQVAAADSRSALRVPE